MCSVCVRVTWVKSNGSTKYVELSVEGFWTRVQFPPPPPKFSNPLVHNGFFRFRVENLCQSVWCPKLVSQRQSMAIRFPSYLHRNRHNIFGFRIAIPTSLRVESCSKECRVSLRTSDVKQAKRLARELGWFTQAYFSRLTKKMKTGEADSPFDFVSDLRAERDRLTSKLLELSERTEQNEERVQAVNERIAYLQEVSAFLDAAEQSENLPDEQKALIVQAREAWQEELHGLLPELFELLANEESINNDARQLRETWVRSALTSEHESQIEQQTAQHEAEKDSLADFVSRIAAKTSQNDAGSAFADHPTPSYQQQPSELLSTVIEAYCESQKAEGNWTEKTEEEVRAMLSLWLRIVGDQPIRSYKHDAHREYRSKLLKLPPNLNKIPRYKGKTIDEVIELGDKPAAPNTINKNLIRVAALFDYATRFGYTELNPASGMTIKNPKRANEERKAFNNEDLDKLFGSIEYRDNKHSHPYAHWLPLLALYTGARLNELCQLHLADFQTIDGINVISISGEGGDKRLKTKAARRLVPVHPELHQLGLMDYIQTLTDKGETRLFPELKKGRDGYGQTASKWFGRYRKRCGITEDGKVFHSFRHTFIDGLKQAGVPKEHIAALVGHEDDSETFGRYGKDFQPEILLNALSKLHTDNPLIKKHHDEH